MPTSKPRRRPPLLESLGAYLPSLLAVLVAVSIPRPFEAYSLILLLAAASLSMAATCHALGLGCEATFIRSVLRRGSTHLIALALYTAVVFVLVAWPLVALARAPSLGAALGLATALALALALLWRLWPVFGLVCEWEDAFPAGARHSWITTALARSLSFAQHLTRGREVFASHFLPAALAQLAVAFAALALAGIGARFPDEIRSAALLLYALVLLPVASLIVANRTLRLLFDGRTTLRLAPDGPVLAVTAPATPAAGVNTDVAPASPASPVIAAEPAPPPAPAPAAPALGSAAALPAANGAPAAVAPVPPAPAPVAAGIAQEELDQHLLDAVDAGNLAAAADWLGRGADANAVPAPGMRDQRSALVRAAELADTHVLRALITHGGNVNRAHAGLTPLLAATRSCRAGRPETVTVLIANGANPATADSEGNTPLHHAALCGEAGIAAILIDAQAPLEARNHNQATPLAVAAGAANWPLLHFLLERGARADAALPMAASIADDDVEGVRSLLKHKADVGAADALGASALLQAAREGHANITRVLLAAGADPAQADRYGTTALMEAARAGATAVVQLLAEKHPDVHAADHHGRTALLLACQSPRADVECVRALLALGADPARRGQDGRSAIDQASAMGRWDLVALLDPAAPLPASRSAVAAPAVGADTPAHLLDALRFAHWSVAARFAAQARTWPAATLAGLFLELAEHADGGARAWLLEHGLDAEAGLADGTRLFDAVLEHLPKALPAVQQLLAAGATPAGAGRFAGALARLDGGFDDVPLALAMLAGGADAFGADASGRAPLHHACRPPLLPVLETLLAHGADPNVRDRSGVTPLHLAAAGNPDAVLPLIQLLVKYGADPELASASGETPLGLALARGAGKLEYWLHWNGWNVPHRPLRGADLPAAAADADAVARLLELGLPVDSRDARGATALLRACGAGALASVQRLLAAHADPELTVTTGASPLSAAVSGRHADCVFALIAAGMDIDRRHADDVTALMIAAALGYPDMVKTLREIGAQTDLTDARGRTALHAAARFCFDSRDSLRCRRLLDALLDQNLNPDTPDKAGATPLLVLLGVDTKPGAQCDGTHLGALLPVLLDADAVIGHADDHGVTPLHACAMHALFEPARVLLAHGADREARDCMNRTPAEVARVLGYVDLALELAPRHGPPPGVERTLRTPVPPVT